MDAGPGGTAGARRWDPARLPDATRHLFAPGSRFELRTEEVLGVPLTVFARRHGHLRAQLEHAVAERGDTAYLVFPATGTALTVADAAASIARVARWLADQGVCRGDRVAFASANVPEYTIGWWATVVLGAVTTGLNAWWTAPELAHGVEVSDPSLVLADEQRLARFSSLDVRSHLLDELSGLVGPTRADDPPLPDAPIDEDDPACLLFTSGTTGRPKAACLSHRNFVHAAQVVGLSGAIAAATMPRPDVAVQPASLAVSPLFHVSGCLPLVTASTSGMKMVYPPPGRWDALTHLRLTEEHSITNWNCVPTLFWRLLEHPDFDRFDTSSLRLVGGGGAVFAPELVRLMARKLPDARLAYGYGMSETLGSGTRLGGPYLESHPDSVGVVEPLCEVVLRNDRGDSVADGEVGEICIKGASVFLGYWRDDEATAQALDDERWYRTGDFGRFEGDVLTLESRMRDLIIRGGENIYPIEIENRLAEHPDVADACIVGIDHPDLGQEVAAAVVTRTGASLDADAIRQWVAAALAPFKVPAYVVFRHELPYNATGKVLKHEVEADLAASVRS